MDERRHHPQPGNGHPQLDPSGYAPGHYDGGGHAAPWPGHAMPAHQPGAPTQGHVPHHAPHPQHSGPSQPQQQLVQPSMQQFQYAGGGFVLPGAPQGQSPMSAHGSMIGVPYPQQPPHQFAANAPGALPSHAGGSTDPYARPQAWAFATPSGMQLVQPGAAAVHVASVEWAPPTDAGETAAVAAPAAMRSRLRWETIIPVGALVCFLAAVAVFVSDFDRMTGRDATKGAKADTSTPAATGTPPAAVDPSDPAQAVAQAAALYRQGRFEAAAKLLYPVVSVASPNAKAVALYDRASAAGKRNAALLAAMARHRKAARWTAVIRTIGQLEQLRPLTPSMVKLRATARGKVRVANALSKARSLARQGRYTAALAVVDKALEPGPSAELSRLREQISARTAAPSTASASTAASGGGRGSAPPVSGGQRPTGGSAPAAQPPSDIPSGAMPPRPDAPNPNNGATGGGVTGTMDPAMNHQGMPM